MHVRNQILVGGCIVSLFLLSEFFVGWTSFHPATSQAADAPAKASPTEISGREIFLREWLPNDPRSHGGDGLGPVFNDTSCVACHNLGGVGGGGPASKNVDLVAMIRDGRNTDRSRRKSAKRDGSFDQPATRIDIVWRMLLGLPIPPVDPEPNSGQRI